MRNITKQAVKAFINDECFNKSNTAVIIDGGITKLALHGNVIALKCPRDGVLLSMCGWGTSTTKERLNGLLGGLNAGFRLRQISGTQYACKLDDTKRVEFDEHKQYSISHILSKLAS